MTTRFFPSHRLWVAFWCLRSDVLCLLRLGSRQCGVPRLAHVLESLRWKRCSHLTSTDHYSEKLPSAVPTIHPHRTCSAALFVLGKKVISARTLKLSIRSERGKKNVRTLKNKLNRGDVQRKLSKENTFHLENSTGTRIEHKSEGREEREENWIEKGKISMLTIIVQHVSVHSRSAQERRVVATGREEQGQSDLLLLTYGWALDSGRWQSLPL